LLPSAFSSASPPASSSSTMPMSSRIFSFANSGAPTPVAMATESLGRASMASARPFSSLKFIFA